MEFLLKEGKSIFIFQSALPSEDLKNYGTLLKRKVHLKRGCWVLNILTELKESFFLVINASEQQEAVAPGHCLSAPLKCSNRKLLIPHRDAFYQGEAPY